MKLKVDDDSNVPEIGHAETRSEIKLPQGLFGFAEIRSMELVFDQDLNITAFDEKPALSQRKISGGFF